MRGELPVVTKSNAALPLKGDVVTSVNGDSLEGLSDPFDEVMGRVKSLPRPITLGFGPLVLPNTKMCMKQVVT